MNIVNRKHFAILWLMAAGAIVISGQNDVVRHRNPPPMSKQQPNFRPIDKFNKQNNFNQKNRPPLPPPPSPLINFDKMGRMGQELRQRMTQVINTDNLRSMISSYMNGGGDYSDCCSHLDFNTFVPGFVLVAVSYALLFLLNATVTSGRRKRQIDTSEEETSKFRFFKNQLVKIIKLEIITTGKKESIDSISKSVSASHLNTVPE